MSSIEKKLDQLIKNAADLSKRINSVDQKLDKINERLDLTEIKMDQDENRIDELEGKNSDLESLVHFKLPQNEFEAHLKDFNEIKSLMLNFQTEAIAQEAYNKRMNVLIHVIDEDSAWETREQTSKNFYEFLQEGLKILKPLVPQPIDLHRLLQHPVSRQGSKVCRPIITKLATSADKNRIFKAAGRLEAYNEARCADNRSSVYVSDHLPEAYLRQKKTSTSVVQTILKMITKKLCGVW